MFPSGREFFRAHALPRAQGTYALTFPRDNTLLPHHQPILLLGSIEGVDTGALFARGGSAVRFPDHAAKILEGAGEAAWPVQVQQDSLPGPAMV